MAPPDDDEARWADAQSILDRAPTEAARRELGRWRMQRLLFVAGLALFGAVVGLVVYLVLDSGVDDASGGTAPWRRITGLVVVSSGLVLAVVGAVAQIRAARALRAWHNPLAALTREQRKQLLAQVRGQAPAEAATLPQARYLAQALVQQRAAPVSQFGLVALFAGQWIMSPTAFRLVLAVLLAVLAVVGVPLLRRDAGRARAFLLAHPPTERDPSAP
jgi:MFS family permease